jgi:hypothetical protein
MDASQKTSTATILIRLSACAIIGLGIMVLYMGVFSSVGTGTMCFAGGAVIGFGAMLLVANPRKAIERPNGRASEYGNSCPMCGASIDANQRRCLSCGENLAGYDVAGARETAPFETARKIISTLLVPILGAGVGALIPCILGSYPLFFVCVAFAIGGKIASVILRELIRNRAVFRNFFK